MAIMRGTRRPFFFGMQVKLVMSFLFFGLVISAIAAIFFYLTLEDVGQSDRFWVVVANHTTGLLLLVLLILGTAFLLGRRLANRLNQITDTVRALQVDPKHRPEHLNALTKYFPRVVRDEFDALLDAVKDFTTRLFEREENLKQLVCERSVMIEKNNQMLRHFLHYTSHRLRTPLNRMRWSADILKSEEKGTLNAAQREVLTELEMALLSVIELSDDLLESLALEDKKVTPGAVERVDLVEIIDSAAGDVSVLARQHQVKLTWKRPKQTVFGFLKSSRVHSALMNLLQNAILYNNEGGVVTIRLEKVKALTMPQGARGWNVPMEHGPFAVVTITDNGIGVPPEERSQLFERFFRGRDARSRWVDGEGIGLSVVRSVAAQHGGALWFAPNPKEKGSVFTLTLPVEE